MDAGNLTFINGVPRITGQYSGFDTAAIVEATILAKRIPAIRMESTIENNDLKTAAYGQLNTLLSNLKSSLSGLRNPPGLSGIDSNLFENKSGFLTSSTSTPATDLLGVSSTNSSVTGTYDVEILQVATANKVSSGSVADGTAAQGVTDTITIGLTGATTKDVAITSDMTLYEIAEAINGVTGDTDVRASVIKVSDTDYRLIVTGEETGKAVSISGAGNFLSTFGDGANLSEIQAADKAQIKIDGIATVIERDSNQISDVIEGVTLQLFKAEVGNNIKVELDHNLGAVKEAINNFVVAYNEIKDFVKSQQNYDPASTTSSKPILYGDDILRRIDTNMTSILANGALGVDSTGLNNINLIGLAFDDDNKLTIDDTKLDDVLVNNLEGVRDVFEFSFKTDDSRLRVISRSEALNVDDFELIIDGVDGSGNITGASVTGYGDVFDINGAGLVGKAGTAFEGITLAFVGTAGSGAQTINVKTSLGIADNLFQGLDRFVKTGTGEIPTRLEQLTTDNTDMNEKIQAIDARLELTKSFLYQKYARLEQVLAQADATRKQLEASLSQSS
ncbi:flagellar filament capping protein FliD [Kiloniella antarctica]|uniref:Flagellar hook-associated protein 2 n=1 Tax=Kiloniella antarctica TaxID=1550907 RepID=A0ABW5BR89_9PROT